MSAYALATEHAQLLRTRTQTRINAERDARRRQQRRARRVRWNAWDWFTAINKALWVCVVLCAMWVLNNPHYYLALVFTTFAAALVTMFHYALQATLELDALLTTTKEDVCTETSAPADVSCGDSPSSPSGVSSSSTPAESLLDSMLGSPTSSTPQ